MPYNLLTQSTLLFNQLVKSINNKQNETIDIAHLRRRFLKDNNLEKPKRSGHVEKYQQYRISNFSDIQIKFSELIAPLQALAQRDSIIAMKLFESIFVSIQSEMTYYKDESESNLIIKQIYQNLNTMLNKSDL